VIVGVIGLGKLGLPFALTFAHAGAHVLTYDRDENVLAAVSSHKAHIIEPMVSQLLEQCELEIATPLEMGQRVRIIFIIVPTPSTDGGSFSDEYVRDVITSLPSDPSPLVAEDDVDSTDHIIAVVSTVSPGAFTGDNALQKLAERHGYKLVYTPTLIALGSVINDLVYPDVQIIGGDDPEIEAMLIARRAFRVITRSRIVCMSYESAAIAKLASNVFVTLKIGFANTLAQVCDSFDADVNDVTHALGCNKRIGPKALTAGAGYGGPCFPRDAAAFAAIAPDIGAGYLGFMVMNLNNAHLDYVLERVKMAPGETYAVLGREYKEGSPYVIESFGDRLARELDRYLIRSVEQAADIVVIAQPLRNVDLTHVLKGGAFVYDLWRTHGYLARRNDLTYVQLGRRSTNDA
jgi:UDPglucose 6-dehydrogenase